MRRGWRKLREQSALFAPELRRMDEWEQERMLGASTSLSTTPTSTEPRAGFPDLLTRRRLPHSALLVLGGWSVQGPSALCELYDGYEGEWLEPQHHVLGLRWVSICFEALEQPRIRFGADNALKNSQIIFADLTDCNVRLCNSFLVVD